MHMSMHFESCDSANATSISAWLAGGPSNRVVEWHPRACQHCGDHSVAANDKCVSCSISVHTSCVSFISQRGQVAAHQNDMCDMCVHEMSTPLSVRTTTTTTSTTCALCLTPDPDVTRPDSTDRLVKKILCYGRTWRRVPHNDIEALSVHGYYRIYDESIEDAPAVHDVSTLWEHGSRPMFVVKSSGCILVSDPLVVHSWCMQCLFQVRVDDRSSTQATLVFSIPASTARVIEELDNPTRLVSVRRSILSVSSRARRMKCMQGNARFASQQQQRGREREQGAMSSSAIRVATFETHECVFCHKQTGWTTFCMAHMASERGCAVCTDADASATHAFHPSCAVFAGMQRASRIEGYGMVCAANSEWRNAIFSGIGDFLAYMSGLNWFVTGEASSIVPDVGTALKGSRYKVDSRSCTLTPEWERGRERERERERERTTLTTHAIVSRASSASSSTQEDADNLSFNQVHLRNSMLAILDNRDMQQGPPTNVAHDANIFLGGSVLGAHVETHDLGLRHALLDALRRPPEERVSVESAMHTPLPLKKRKLN